MRVYRDQLAEIDRDMARGIIPTEEAERTKLEVQRRILELDRDARGDRGPLPRGRAAEPWVVLVVALVGAVGGLWMVGVPDYPDMPLAERHAQAQEARANRPGQAAAGSANMPKPFPARSISGP